MCWVLKHLFSEPDLKDHLVFKGGTSLSKVYGLIHRFSEDIDLILYWTLLGYGQGKVDPYTDQPSKNRQSNFNKRLNQKAVTYIEGTLLSQFRKGFESCPGLVTEIDQDDPQTVNVTYPASFENEYVRPVVRLEIGPLASMVPSQPHTIQAYAANEFPDLFEDAACPVVAIDARRTFWEKATILHQEAHRASQVPSRHSRHYYDLHQLCRSDVRAEALADLGLLGEVVAFKQKFYLSSWANYEEARPGTFRLIPSEDNERHLRQDYAQMRDMIFDEVPSFDSILISLRELENDINAKSDGT